MSKVICSPFLIRLGLTVLHMNMVTESLLLATHVLHRPGEKERGKRKEGGEEGVSVTACDSVEW